MKRIINILVIFSIFLLILINCSEGKAQKVINEYSRIISIQNSDTTDVDSVEVNDPGIFATSDTVLFIVMKGSEIYTSADFPGFPAFWGNIYNLNNTGIYNILLVNKVSGNYVIFTTKLRKLNPVKAGEVYQLIKVRGGKAVYEVNEPHTCKPWDPVDGTGGVFALIAGRKIVLNDVIDVTGKGFRGGDPDNPSTDYFKGNCSEAVDAFYKENGVDSSGRKGEGIVYDGFQYTRGMLFCVSSGGGGNGKYSGGGGGGNYGTGGKGGKESESCLPFDNLGGLGKFISNYYSNSGTFPNRIFMGGGGGTGTQNPDNSRLATAGGHGGGIIILITDTIETQGGSIVYAKGESVSDTATAGAGGGGGGGIIILEVNTYTGNITFNVEGGNGGWTNHQDPTGPGGFGGGGVIWYSGNNLPVNVTKKIDNGKPGQHITAGLRGAISASTQRGTVLNNLRIPLSGFLFNIMPEDQDICEGSTPFPFYASKPKGGTWSYTYKWLRSPDKVTWSDAPGKNDSIYYVSGSLTDTTYFRRIVCSGSTIDTSLLLTIKVHPYSVMNLTFNAEHTSSIGDTDGAIDIQLSGGCSPFTFNWSNGEITEDISLLTAGVYIVTVTDTRDSTLADSIRIYDTFIDERDGQRYKAVKIGNQIWMAENLKATIYNNGDNIPNVTDNTEWIKLSTGAYCYYNNDSSTFAGTYGALYNFYSVADTRKLCPSKWHVPTDAEWTNLVNNLGGESIAGGKLKEAGIVHWRSPNVGATNETGFTALPGGVRWDSTGFSYNIGDDGGWWSATEENITNAFIRRLIWEGSEFTSRPSAGKKDGYSVRCLKQTECLITGVQFQKNDISCFGLDDGSAGIFIAEYGIKGITWSNGDTIEDIGNLAAGWYKVTVTDSLDCSLSDSIEILEPSLLIADVTDSSNITSAGASDGWATVTASGGTLPYSYQWDDNLSTIDSTVTGLSANKWYHIIVTDANGCIKADSVILSEPGVVNPSIVVTITIYPNPFSDNTTINFSNPDHYVYQLILTDLTGKVLLIKDNLIEETYELSRENLSEGLYLIELRGKNIYRGKIIIE